MTKAAQIANATVSGTVNSVDVSGGATGLTFSGSPITSSGTITMAGNLAVTSGGTGLNKKPPFMMVYANTAATATYVSGGLSPYVTVKYNTIVVDTETAFNTTANSYTPKTPGYYRVTVTVLETAIGTGAYTIVLLLSKNGARYMVAEELINYAAGYVQTMQLTTIISMNGSTDTLTASIATNSGSITYVTGLDTQMIAEWIGPL
jgi:hypothetical protein